MRKVYKHIVLPSAIVIVILFSCVEPFEIATQNFEDLLVIEATITNEFKYQEIKLGRTYPLEDEGPSYEINANVTVVDDAQNSYNFQETDSGRYRSISEFSVLPNRNYQLLITTTSGKEYASVPTKLTAISSDFTVSAIKEVNKDGIEGITIYADSYDSSGNSKYYRFEYEETYKIIAPYWSPLDAFGVSMLPTNPNPPPLHEVYTLPRTQEEETCYKTLESTKIMQTDTNLFLEDRVIKFPIIFLTKDDFKITHRYSILVRQFVQSLEASTFYKTLNKFSGSESLFSQQQQGFIAGNVFSVNNPDEKVIGYFEVASALTERIFFNFEDFFPNEPKPPYIVECIVIAPALDDTGPGEDAANFSPLIKLLLYDGFKFVDFNGNSINNPYFIVRKECGDCTSLGSNIRPDFWID
jgi:Domain of unknown function (DUF4249)